MRHWKILLGSAAVVCLGAGNSTDWAHALPEWLAGEPKRAGGKA